MSWSPSVERRRIGQFGVEVRLGHPLLDDYLRFVAARCRPNTVLATGFDLKVFFTFTGKDPLEVTMADVLDFIADQRAPRRGGNVVRLEGGESGLSSRTVRRRLATLSGLFGYLVARGAVSASPVPAGITTRTRGGPGGRRRTAAPLIRTPYTLPRLLSPPEAIALLGAVRTARDAAMVEAMLLGAYAAARSWDCAWRTCTWLTSDSSSPAARAVANGSCRSPAGSSPPWPPI